MVFSGKPSRACEPCREKRRKCDLKKPSCSTCMRMGISCFGYRDVNSVKIKDQTTAVIRKVQRQKCNNTRLMSKVTSPDSGYFSPTSLDQQDVVEINCHRISPPPEELALGYFFFVFTRSGPFGYLLEHTNTLAVDTDIIEAIHAPALASMALEHRRDDLQRTARYHYSKALTQTNRDLSDPQVAILDKTLLRVLLLSNFEGLVFEGRGSTRNWELHVQGSLRLLVLRGKQQFETQFGCMLFFHASINVLTDCIMRSLPIPEEFHELYEYAIARLSKLDDARFRMIRFVYRLAKLSDARRSMLATEVIRECMTLDKEVTHLTDKFYNQSLYEVIDVTTDEFRAENPNIYAYKDTIHKYRSQNIARILNTTRLMRMTLKEWIFDILGENRWGVIPNEPSEGDPLKGGWNQLQVKSALQASDIIDEMLASVPYLLELADAQFHAAARYIVWPLSNSAGSPICPAPARLYIIHQLKELARKAKLDQAMHAARMLEERVPREDWMHLLHLS
ncbi:hypothetical protein F53441_1957 [Fusarium austroafricanum]|uniref:Zn(2)-C6 fungal-type domain-containing protein n=1 Tax=Fusarium austroafricanum TaxID=2364996 RepID=A0A8H4KUZ1_9HYPO|nr:hypothetical protein F53441_1957 [Fusarium austroafricanum]